MSGHHFRCYCQEHYFSAEGKKRGKLKLVYLLYLYFETMPSVAQADLKLCLVEDDLELLTPSPSDGDDGCGALWYSLPSAVSSLDTSKVEYWLHVVTVQFLTDAQCLLL